MPWKNGRLTKADYREKLEATEVQYLVKDTLKTLGQQLGAQTGQKQERKNSIAHFWKLPQVFLHQRKPQIHQVRQLHLTSVTTSHASSSTIEHSSYWGIQRTISTSQLLLPMIERAMDNRNEKECERDLREEQQATTAWNAAITEQTAMESTIFDWATDGDGVYRYPWELFNCEDLLRTRAADNHFYYHRIAVSSERKTVSDYYRLIPRELVPSPWRRKGRNYQLLLSGGGLPLARGWPVHSSWHPGRCQSSLDKRSASRACLNAANNV